MDIEMTIEMTQSEVADIVRSTMCERVDIPAGYTLICEPSLYARGGYKGFIKKMEVPDADVHSDAVVS